MTECIYYWIRDILDQEELEKAQVCSQMHCGSPSEFSLLIAEKNRRRFLDEQIIPCFSELRPKTSRIQKLFNLSKEDDVQQSVIRKSLNKEGKTHRTKAPKIQSPDTPRILQAKYQCLAIWRHKPLRKPRRRLQSMLNFWSREWRKPKKNARNRLSRNVVWPCWELLLLSMSPGKLVFK